MKKLTLVLGSIVFLLLSSFATYADCQFQGNVLLQVINNSYIYEQPDCKSTMVGLAMKDDAVISLQPDDGQWILVKNGDVEGYVEVQNLTIFREDGISQEFEKKTTEMDFWLEEVEMKRLQRQEKIIWGMIIVILILAMFVVGLAQQLHQMKKKQQENKKNGKIEDVCVKGEVQEMQTQEMQKQEAPLQEEISEEDSSKKKGKKKKHKKKK